MSWRLMGNLAGKHMHKNIEKHFSALLNNYKDSKLHDTDQLQD